MEAPIAANDNTKRSTLPPSLKPRGVSRVVAAEYIGMSPSLFDEGVKDGTFPKPKRFRGRTIWDVRELDRAFDALPGGDQTNPWHEAFA